MSTDQWLSLAESYETHIRTIQDRGGDVVLIHFPESGLLWDMTSTRWPQKTYWRPFEQATAATTVHFKDDPRLANFECPDTSHLDMHDAPAFTAALLTILDEKGVWDGRKP